MKKALIFVLALVLLVGVLAACGGKEVPTTNKPAVTTTAPKGTEPKTTAPKTTTTAVTTTEEVEVTTAPYDKVEGITRDPVNAGEFDGDIFEGPIDSNPNAD
jgi:predicted small lipoprotein YifL